MRLPAGVARRVEGRVQAGQAAAQELRGEVHLGIRIRGALRTQGGVETGGGDPQTTEERPRLVHRVHLDLDVALHRDPPRETQGAQRDAPLESGLLLPLPREVVSGGVSGGVGSRTRAARLPVLTGERRLRAPRPREREGHGGALLWDGDAHPVPVDDVLDHAVRPPRALQERKELLALLRALRDVVDVPSGRLPVLAMHPLPALHRALLRGDEVVVMRAALLVAAVANHRRQPAKHKHLRRVRAGASGSMSRIPPGGVRTRTIRRDVALVGGNQDRAELRALLRVVAPVGVGVGVGVGSAAAAEVARVLQRHLHVAPTHRALKNSRASNAHGSGSTPRRAFPILGARTELRCTLRSAPSAACTTMASPLAASTHRAMNAREDAPPPPDAPPPAAPLGSAPRLGGGGRTRARA